MRATVHPGRPTALAIHDDGDALELLARLLEGGGFEVLTAASGFDAQAHLEGARAIDVVVVPWDARNVLGGDVYRWSLRYRYDLRDQFVFLGAEVPPEFDRLVAGRCLAVSPEDPVEVVRVARAVVRRRARRDAADGELVGALDDDRPTLLLAEDDPTLLLVMGDLLAEAGYAVSRADGGRGAIERLAGDDFDAIVAAYRMGGGSGADLYRWILAEKPWLADRVVFLAGEEGTDAGAVAPGRPIFRKGADSHALADVLREIVRRARGEPPA